MIYKILNLNFNIVQKIDAYHIYDICGHICRYVYGFTYAVDSNLYYAFHKYIMMQTNQKKDLDVHSNKPVIIKVSVQYDYKRNIFKKIH
jgi:hypothetical protein